MVDSESEFEPDGTRGRATPGRLSIPDDNEEPSLADDNVGVASPAKRPVNGRTRSTPIQVPDAMDVPSSLDLSIPDVVPNAIEEPQPIEAGPSSIPGGNRSRSSVPTPIDRDMPAEFGAPPAPPASPVRPSIPHNPSKGRSIPGTPTPNAEVDSTSGRRSSIPSNGLPTRNITPEMLIGDATVENPLLVPTQQPQLRIEKKAQANAEVGEKFVYEIIVQNVGQVAAQHVVVEERIPKGCRMERSQPQAHLGRDHILRWDLETMQPNAQKVIKVEITPLEAGAVGSVATLRFAAQVATKTMVTAPTLSLSIKHPPEVAVGEQVPVKFVITNTGTGTARKATLRALLQEGLQHPAGLDLDQDLGTLAPGQSKEIDLVLVAAEQGRYTPSVIVTANGIEQENRTLDLSVIESRLTLSRVGHARRFVNRPAEFTTKVSNHSVETMKDVMITEQLPEGVTPVGETGKFAWSPKDRTVTWKVSELGPGQYSDLKLTVVSTRAGVLAGKVHAATASGYRAELPTELEVQGFSSLTLDIQGDGKAVAVGEQVSMRVTVGNRGSAPAKNVQAQFELPRQMVFVDAKGPSTFKREGNLITFAELEEVDPNSVQTYDIVLTAAEEGTPSVTVDLFSKDRTEPVRQQEAVRITP